MHTAVKKYFLIAGEPSGDLHGGNLIKAIRTLNPNSSFMGLGGDNMKQEGMRIIEHVDKLSIMGFTEVLSHLPRMIRIMQKTLDAISRAKPNRIILIDYPGFNLRLAKKISYMKIPITYFILPQAWAWKEGRVEKMKEYIDQAISIFPFEAEWYRSQDFDVEYFGHPFMDLEHMNESTKSVFERHSLDINRPILTLLPGSRQQEIDRHWPIYLETVELLRKNNYDIQILVGKSPNIILNNCPTDFKIETNARKTMVVGTVALVSSGTATLECAIEETPMVVCYKLFPISWLMAKFLVKVKHSSIVNLIVGREIVPELIQNKMRPGLILKKLAPLIDSKSKKRKVMLSDFKTLKESLGSPGVYESTAKSISKKTH